MARAYLVCMVVARRRMDDTSFLKACKAVIEDLNKELKKLPENVDLGAVIRSREVKDTEVESRGHQKQDQKTKSINALERYRREFLRGTVGSLGPYGGPGAAQRRYASMIQFVEQCQDDDSAETTAYLQHMYEYYRTLALKRIIRAS